MLRIRQFGNEIGRIAYQQSAEELCSHHAKFSFKAHFGVWVVMVIPTDDRAADNGSINASSSIIVIIMILQSV